MMGAAGLGQSASKLFSSGSIEYPRSDSAIMWRRADIRVRIRPKLSAGIFFSQSETGSTYGNHQGGSFLNSLDLSAEYALRTIAPTVTYHSVPRVRLGIGPALCRMTFNAPEAAFGVSEHKLGWSAQAGLAFLNRKRVFSELTLHYLGALGMTVDGFTVGNAYSPAGRSLHVPAPQVVSGRRH
jgi:hypothetical protein